MKLHFAVHLNNLDDSPGKLAEIPSSCVSVHLLEDDR
jgi:hypothetical protein